MRARDLNSVTSFVDPRSGQRRYLKDSDGLATQRQLWKLNERGLLVVVDRPMEPIKVGEAAWVLNATNDE